jgi:hypothetical protein
MKKMEAPNHAPRECPRYILGIEADDLNLPADKLMQTAAQCGAATWDCRTGETFCWFTFTYDTKVRVYQYDEPSLARNLRHEREKLAAKEKEILTASVATS